MSSGYHLAQLNIGTALDSMESEVMKDFTDNLELINGIGENSPGFVWRLKDESGDATAIEFTDDPNVLVNLTVWQDLQSLKDFVFKTQHATFLARKKEWFKPVSEATYALWWIPEGHIPSLEEAKAKLDHLNEHGESPSAFSFKKLYGPQG